MGLQAIIVLSAPGAAGYRGAVAVRRRRRVEKLWTARAKPVEKLTTKKYLWPDRGVDPAEHDVWTTPS